MNFAPSWRFPAAVLLAAANASVACAHGAAPCASERGCPRARECLAMRCVPEGAAPVAPETDRVVALPSAIALASEDGRRAAAASVTLGDRSSLYLRFDPIWERGRVHAAFLLLDPAEGSVAGDDVELEVGRARRAWSGAAFDWSRQPGFAAPFARGIARARPPLPIRIDVTELVRFASEHARQDHGFVVRATSHAPAGVTIATGSDGGRAPELDVYLGPEPP